MSRGKGLKCQDDIQQQEWPPHPTLHTGVQLSTSFTTEQETCHQLFSASMFIWEESFEWKAENLCLRIVLCGCFPGAIHAISFLGIPKIYEVGGCSAPILQMRISREEAKRKYGNTVSKPQDKL